MLLLIILLIIMSDNLLFDFDNLVQGSYPKGLNYAQAQNHLNTEEKCKLFSKKADAVTYYTHTYDPTAMIAKVRGELGLSEEVLDRFDSVRREGCCNVISITLYVTDKYCKLDVLQKYLYSIHRTVKNVLKKLPGWIVRVYFDISVEECVTKAEFGEFNEIFNAIKVSPNVEVYTYDCPSFKKGASGEESQIPIARTRTLRFLPLSDPEVNLCVVREADGIVSNLDCHNIQMYASNPNILFYLPKVLDYTIDTKFGSYSFWLRIYKIMFGREYFKDHQNLKDLLAGAFCCKLKLKRDYYQETVNSLQGEITAFFSKTREEQAAEPFMSDKTFIQYPHTIGSLIANNLDGVLLQLTTGFDEILLLAMYKDLISVPFVCNDNNYIDWTAEANQSVEMKTIKNMLIADDDKNISTIAIRWTESDSSSPSYWERPTHINLRNEIIENFKEVHQLLVSKNIIPALDISVALKKFDNNFKIKVDGWNRDNYFLYIIDALLLGNIEAATALNIKVVYSVQHYVSQLLNVPYDPKLDLIYDDQPGRGGGKRKRRFSRKIKKQSRHRRKLRMRKSRRKSRK